MSQISLPDVASLLEKLFTERVPQCFWSRYGTRVNLRGFLDSATRANGIYISVSGPPVDVSRGYMNFSPFNRECDFWYGEKRELSKELLEVLEARGESVLMFMVPNAKDPDERFCLFFTV